MKYFTDALYFWAYHLRQPNRSIVTSVFWLNLNGGRMYRKGVWL